MIKGSSFAEAIATAGEMQQDWLEPCVNFVDLYVEDVDDDWLERWGEVKLQRPLLNLGERIVSEV